MFFKIDPIDPIDQIRDTVSRSFCSTDLAAKHLVLMDDRLADLSTLRDALQSNTELTIVRHNEDGFAAIERALQQAASNTSKITSKIASVHLLGHAVSGNLWLGHTPFNQDSIAQHRSQLADGSKYLASDAAIAIYGCEFAALGHGTQTTEQLSEILQRPIFAASHRVGAAKAGGLWALDVFCDRGRTAYLSLREAIAPIDRVFDRDRLQTYAHSFAPPNLLYGVNKDREIFTVNLADGSTEVQAILPFPSFSLARSYNVNDPNDPGLLYFTSTDPNTDIRFGSWNPATAEAIELPSIARDLGNSDPNDDVKGNFTRFSQHQDGRLFAFSGQSSDLYEIDPTTSKAVLSAKMEFNGASFPIGGGDIVFDPNNPNRLYILLTNVGLNLYELYRADLSDHHTPGIDQTVSTDLVGKISTSTGALLSPQEAGAFGVGENGDFYITSLSQASDEVKNTGLYRLDVDAVNASNGGTLVAEFVGVLGRGASDFASFPTPTAQIDLRVTKDDGQEVVRVGDRVTYTITVTNPSEPAPGFVAFSIEGVEVVDNVSPGLIDVTWEADFTAGTGNFPSLADRRGTGSVDSTIDLGIGATVTYHVTGIVGPNTPETLQNTVSVELPPGFNLANPDHLAPEDTVFGTDVTKVLPAEIDLPISHSADGSGGTSDLGGTGNSTGSGSGRVDTSTGSDSTGDSTDSTDSTDPTDSTDSTDPTDSSSLTSELDDFVLEIPTLIAVSIDLTNPFTGFFQG